MRLQLPPRHVLGYFPYVFLGGGIIGLAMGGFRWSFRNFLHGAWIAVACFGCALIAEMFLHEWLENGPGWRRGITYALASQVGWPIGLFTGLPLIHGEPMSTIRFSRIGWTMIIIMSAVGPLAGIAAHGYERLKERLRASVEQLKEKEFADKELELARALQSRMLPAQEIAADGYRISSRNLAARYVAGDFYDVFQYGDGSIGIAVADVAGKGMAASLIMASVKAVLPLLATNRTVDDAVIALNEKLVGELSKREFVALALARYEPATGKLSFVNAGLPDPYLVRGSTADAIEATGPRLPLGLRRGTKYERRELELLEGDALVFFSDGLPEAPMADGDQLGYERLAEIVRDHATDVDRLLERIDTVTGTLRDDDQTVVMLRRG